MNFKTALGGVLVVAASLVGCSSNPNIMSPRVDAILDDVRQELSIQKVNAYTYWSSSYGHGLAVEVNATRPTGGYARNLDLELQSASVVFAELAKSEVALEWEFVKVQFFIDFGLILRASRQVSGFAEVIIQREKLRMLRDKDASAADYPSHWVFVRGYKDQPDSGEPIRW